jgi:hypothetical protein
MKWYHTRSPELGGGTSYVLPTQMEEFVASEILQEGISNWFLKFIALEIQRQTCEHSMRLDALFWEEKFKRYDY